MLWLYSANNRMKHLAEQQSERKTDISIIKLPFCHVMLHKSHITFPGVEYPPSQWLVRAAYLKGEKSQLAKHYEATPVINV